MNEMDKSIDNMVKTVIREHLGLGEDDDTPPYTMMSVNEDRFKHETTFNIRIGTSPDYGYIKIVLN